MDLVRPEHLHINIAVIDVVPAAPHHAHLLESLNMYSNRSYPQSVFKREAISEGDMCVNQEYLGDIPNEKEVRTKDSDESLGRLIVEDDIEEF